MSEVAVSLKKLHRREDVEPNAGGNQAERKPSHPRDKRGGKGRRQINGNVDDRCIHRSLVPVISARMAPLGIDSVASLSTCRASTCDVPATRPSHQQKAIE